jgi:adenylate kinase family enzyme
MPTQQPTHRTKANGPSDSQLFQPNQFQTPDGAACVLREGNSPPVTHRGFPSHCFGVILAGIEGVGKTRLSRKLDYRLGWTAFDSDDVTQYVCGIGQSDARRRDDAAAVDARKKLIRDAVLTHPLRRRIIATTLRPLDLDQDPPTETTRAISTVLEENWIVIHLDNDINSIADYFLRHPAAKVLRHRFDGLETFTQIHDRLVIMKDELEPLYARYRDAYVNISGVSDKEAVSRILGAIVTLLLPGDFNNPTMAVVSRAHVIQSALKAATDLCGTDNNLDFNTVFNTLAHALGLRYAKRPCDCLPGSETHRPGCGLEFLQPPRYLREEYLQRHANSLSDQKPEGARED